LSTEHGHIAAIKSDQDRMMASSLEVHSLRTLNPNEYDDLFVTDRDEHGVSEIVLYPTAAELKKAPLQLAEVLEDLDLGESDASIKFRLHKDSDGFDVTFTRVDDPYLSIMLSTTPDRGSVAIRSDEIPLFPDANEAIPRITDTEKRLMAGYKRIATGIASDGTVYHDSRKIGILVSTVSWAKQYIEGKRKPIPAK